jgi:hypothetical protein
MEWGRCHWLDILTRSLQKFESLNLHAQRIFYAINKLAGILIIKNRFSDKKKCRPNLSGPRPHRTGPAQIGCRNAGAAAQRTNRRAPAVSGREGRSGMKRLGPSDQVGIDGPGLSSTSGCWDAGGNPRLARRGPTAHLGGLPDVDDGTRRSGARRRAQRGAGRLVWSPGRWPARPRWWGPIRCSRGSTNWCSWIKIGVVLVSYRSGELVQEEIRGREGLDQRHSSPLPRRLKSHFLSSSPTTEQGGRSLYSGRVRWWCLSRMGVQREAGVCCGFISREVMV